MRLARNRHIGAFSELCQRHSWTAWETAYAVTGDAGDAAEAVSEAFTKLFKPGRFVRYEDSRAVQMAILATTRATAIETVRHSGRDGADGVYDIGGSATSQTRARRGLPIVSAAFRSLPERWRSALWLIEVQGVEPPVAAAVLGVSANGMAQLSIRSRTGLRERYLQAHLKARLADECRPVVQQLAAYVTRELTPNATATVRTHLDSCVECKQRLVDLDHLGDMLRSTAVPIPSTLVAKAMSRWKLEASAAAAVPRQSMRLVPFPTTARKPLAGAALGVLGIGIIGAAVVGGPLLNHGLGGGGITPAAASPSEVNQPFQIGDAISPVLANNLLTVGSGPLAALSGVAAPGAASPATAANQAAAASVTPATSVLPSPAPAPAPPPPAPPPPSSPPITLPSPPSSPPITLPPPLGSGGTGGVIPKLPPPLPNPPPPVGSGSSGGGGSLIPSSPLPPPTISRPPLPSAPPPASPPPPNLLPRVTTPSLSTTLPTLP